MLWFSGMVKKTPQGIIHDCSKLRDGFLEECKSAIARTKESHLGINPATYILNPVKVLFLFQRMLDEVYFSV